jgi:hypothetical protein
MDYLRRRDMSRHALDPGGSRSQPTTEEDLRVATMTDDWAPGCLHQVVVGWLHDVIVDTVWANSDVPLVGQSSATANFTLSCALHGEGAWRPTVTGIPGGRSARVLTV